MLKKKLIALSSVFIIGVLLVAGLKLISDFKGHNSNHFIRRLPPFRISAQNVKNLNAKDMYIAGLKGDSLYLGSQYFKNLLMKVNLRTLDTSIILLKVPKDLKVFNAAYLFIDSTIVYLLDGMKGNVTIGRTHEYTLEKNIQTPNFSSVIALSPNAFLFRCFSKKNENVLAKEVVNQKSFKIKDDILKKQIDGIFCTDGIFLKVPEKNELFYIYYYRNQFIAIDTNLKMLFKANTIDTNSIAKIKVGSIKSDNKITLARPPLYVNKQASANKEYLFIRSSLKADNETDLIHNTMSPIDVYSTQDGSYKFSFYLPDFADEKLTSFEVYGKTLVALFGKYIYTYKLNF